MRNIKENNGTYVEHDDTLTPENQSVSSSSRSVRSLAKRLFNRETLLYALFGILTTLLNLGLFRLLLVFRLDYKLANVITLIVVKLVAYIVNKVFVFRSRAGSFGALCKEFLRYLVTRGFTMLVDYFGLILLVDTLSTDEMVGKCIMTALIVILNYFLGKFIVFNKIGTESEHPGKA